MSSSGAIRIDSLADADGTRVLDDFSTLGALNPMVVSAGLFQSRVRIVPEPIGLDAVEQAGLEAQPLLVVVEVGRLAGLQPLDGEVAVRVVERGDEPDQGGDGVGHGAAEHPRVDAVVERRDRHDDPDQAAQGDGERRFADVPVAGVGEDDGVRAQLLAVPLEDGQQRVAADLLLALDEDRDADRRAVGNARSAAMWAMTPALSSAAPRP